MQANQWPDRRIPLAAMIDITMAGIKRRAAHRPRARANKGERRSCMERKAESGGWRGGNRRGTARDLTSVPSLAFDVPAGIHAHNRSVSSSEVSSKIQKPIPSPASRVSVLRTKSGKPQKTTAAKAVCVLGVCVSFCLTFTKSELGGSV